MEELYLLLNSELSKEQHPDNTPTDFTVELPHPRVLDEQWTCTLKDIQIPITEDVLYVCSDICAESYAENTMVPLLRAVYKPNSKKAITSFVHFEDSININVKSGILNRVRIFIRGGDLKRMDIKTTVVRCTLQLKRWM